MPTRYLPLQETLTVFALMFKKKLSPLTVMKRGMHVSVIREVKQCVMVIRWLVNSVSAAVDLCGWTVD